MEPFVDFGLFEVLAVLGVSALARQVYRSRPLAVLFVLASVALPAALVVLAVAESHRWLAAGALATSLVNVSVVMGALQQGSVPTFRMAGRPSPGTAPAEEVSASRGVAREP